MSAKITSITLEYAAVLAKLDEKCFNDGRFPEKDLQNFMETPFFIGVFVENENEELTAYAFGNCVAGQAELWRVASLPKFRGQGFAAKALEAFSELAEGKGAKQITLEVRTSNVRAIALYERFGFEEIHRRPKYYPCGEDAHVYIKYLSA